MTLETQFEYDRQFADAPLISGIDEAGRGCLAGPVVIARVTWNPRTSAALRWFPRLADSKQIDAATREDLYPRILEAAESVRVAMIGNIMIDHMNILRATLHGFELVAGARRPEVPLLIDGNQKPPTLRWAVTLVKGDSRAGAVAAAGIVAKVTRDAAIRHLAAAYPGYGLANHKGYATKTHREAIARLGPSAIHRRSFKPCTLHDGDDHDLAANIFAGLTTTEGADTTDLWHLMADHYHRLPYAKVPELVRAFQSAGLRVLPTADELEPAHAQPVP